jgi:hypothetical protein
MMTPSKAALAKGQLEIGSNPTDATAKASSFWPAGLACNQVLWLM